MAFIYEALVVPDIAALKALNETSKPKRVVGVFIAVANDGTDIPAWYLCSDDAVAAENLPAIVKSNDTLANWIRFGGSGENSSGGSSGINFSGDVICTNNCPLNSGKAYQFDSAQFGLIDIIVSSEMASQITPSSNCLQISLWSQEPNEFMEGRHFVAEISETGGKVFIAVDDYRPWLTVQARNFNSEDAHDGVCCSFLGNTVTLLSFGDVE